MQSSCGSATRPRMGMPSIQHIDMEMSCVSARAAVGEKLARAALGGGGSIDDTFFSSHLTVLEIRQDKAVTA